MRATTTNLSKLGQVVNTIGLYRPWSGFFDKVVDINLTVNLTPTAWEISRNGEISPNAGKCLGMEV